MISHLYSNSKFKINKEKIKYIVFNFIKYLLIIDFVIVFDRGQKLAKECYKIIFTIIFECLEENTIYFNVKQRFSV